MCNRKVMIVDDDQEFLEELNDTLASSGYDMIVVDDPVSALEEVKKSRPDVILLDLKMPIKSGFQLADEIRHSSELSNTPIIGMSGFFKEDYISLMNICGIKKYLKKPFSPLDVIARIEEVLADNKS